MRVTLSHTKTSSWFAPKLRSALSESGMSVRSVARAWRPNDPETGRRSLFRYLNDGIVPNPSTRTDLATALGVDRSTLEPDVADDEEAQLVADLTDALRLIVAQQVRRAIEDRIVA